MNDSENMGRSRLQNEYLCTIVSAEVLLIMKIFSSSPYATFNPKEWNSLSRTNYKFSDTPIKIQKRYSSTYKVIKSTKIVHKNNDLPKQIQLALT